MTGYNLAGETKVSEKKEVFIELLKFPILVFSILAALTIGRYSLGLTFGPISEISKDGVKFSQEAKGELTDLASRLNGALAAIDELKKITPDAQTNLSKIQAAVVEAEQTVSEQSAQLSTLAVSANDGNSRQGYIFIGNYSGSWSSVKLASTQTGQPITIHPDQLLPGTSYKVLGNMVVRDGLPANDVSYYRGRKSLGTIPLGTEVRVLSRPTGIDREFAVQYWVKVEVL